MNEGDKALTKGEKCQRGASLFVPRLSPTAAKTARRYRRPRPFWIKGKATRDCRRVRRARKACIPFSEPPLLPLLNHALF